MATLSRADDAIAQLASAPVALVILDADAGGLELCHEIVERESGTSILIISASPCQPRDRVAGLLAGADDHLCEPYDRDELLARVRRLLARHAQWTSSALASPSALSPRETEVVQWLAVGQTLQQIANRLVVSHKTVASHVDHILHKLDVHSQAQAVAYAYLHGLVGPGAGRISAQAAGTGPRGR